VCFEIFLSLNPYRFVGHFARRGMEEEWSFGNNEGIATEAMTVEIYLIAVL